MNESGQDQQGHPPSGLAAAPVGLLALLPEALQQFATWQASRWHAYETDATLHVSEDRARAVLDELLARLDDNYPFFHPSYAGQMLKPPHTIAALAYFLAMQINPNNHALDGGPATARMEIECIAALAKMFGYTQHLGHLTSSGTLANLEALWIARNLHPDKSIAFSEQAHYTHGRMCEVLGAKNVKLRCDAQGRLDIDELRAYLKTGRIGTVVVTAGTTALGAVDLIHEIVALQRAYDFRIHCDAAYGGFFRLLADEADALAPEVATAFKAIAKCDSVVIDPHKHGLQPYGCGAVLFKDPSVGRFYKHDSPYTYFTAGDLHLGEISLECSRAGAAAAALWATLQCFPLTPGSVGGLGAILRKTRQAAVAWAKLIEQTDALRLVQTPALDIVNFYAVTNGHSTAAISALTDRVFTALMRDTQQPLYLAKLNLTPRLLTTHHALNWESKSLTVFRSVLMKPEHLAYVPTLHQRLLATLNGKA